MSTYSIRDVACSKISVLIEAERGFVSADAQFLSQVVRDEVERFIDAGLTDADVIALEAMPIVRQLEQKRRSTNKVLRGFQGASTL